MDTKLKFHKYSFEKLEVWKNAMLFAKELYYITEKFPKSELYCLVSQLRRAAISISSNIAEGSTRKSFKDQSRFTEIAYGSLLEVLNQLIFSNSLGYIDADNLIYLRIKIEEIARQLNALKKSQVDRQNNP